MAILSLLTFLPEECIILLVVLTGFAIMFQAKRFATGLLVIAGIMIFLPPIIEPFLSMLPEWALLFLLILITITTPFMLLRILIGKDAFNQMVGTLAAKVVARMFRLPFKFIRIVIRGFLMR